MAPLYKWPIWAGIRWALKISSHKQDNSFDCNYKNPVFPSPVLDPNFLKLSFFLLKKNRRQASRAFNLGGILRTQRSLLWSGCSAKMFRIRANSVINAKWYSERQFPKATVIRLIGEFWRPYHLWLYRKFSYFIVNNSTDRLNVNSYQSLKCLNFS